MQLDDVLTRLTEQEKGIAFVGTTVLQTEQLLRELELLDKQAKASTRTPRTHIHTQALTHTHAHHEHTSTHKHAHTHFLTTFISYNMTFMTITFYFISFVIFQ